MKSEESAKYRTGNTSRYVPENEKNLDWGISLISNITNFIASEGGMWGGLRSAARENFERYAGVPNDKKVKHLIEPHGTRLSTPYRRFPLGRSRIDQVIAEFTLTPPRRHAMCIDKESIDQREQSRIQMSIRQATAEMDASLEKDLGAEIEYNKNVPLVEDVNEFFEKGNYKELWAKQVNTGIEYLYQVRNLMERIQHALKNHLITGRPFFLLQEESGDPMPRVIDPRYCAYEMGSSSDYIDDCGWFYFEYWATLGEIQNEFRDCPEFQGKKGKDLIKKLESLSRAGGNVTQLQFPQGTTRDDWANRTPETGAVIKVARMFWQSSKDLAYKKSKSKDGRTFMTKIDPNKTKVKYNKGEELMMKPVDDPWQIACIGGIAYTDFRRCDEYGIDVDQPGRKPLPVIGLHQGKTDGYNISMQDLLNPIDEMHDEVMFHLRAALARAGGRAILYDISQMPKDFGKNIQKLAHHMKNDGIIAVDFSKVDEENAAGLGSSFNQWKEVDLSLRNEITQLINFRLMLENMADEMSGINDQRRGQGSEYETATNAQQAISRSATRTEIYLYPFNQLLKRLYERLADMMKVTWKDGKSYAFWNPDGAQVMMSVMPDIALHNYGFYVGSNTQDRRHKQQIEQLMHTLSTNSQDPDLLLSMIKIMKVDYADEAEAIFEKGVEIMKKKEEQKMQAESANTDKLVEQQEKDREQKERHHKEDNETKIDVANIQVGGKVIVAETITDNAEMKEKANIVKAGMSSGEKDSKPDQPAETKAKQKQSSMLSNQVK